MGRRRRGLRLKGLEKELGGVLGKEVRTDGEVKHFRHGEQRQRNRRGKKERNAEIDALKEAGRKRPI